jgi:hypothetical protein
MDYEELIDERTLLDSLERCAKSAAWKHSMQDALRNKLAIVHELHKQLSRLDFSFPPHREFDITERGKARHIKAPSIKERIVQKAISENVLVPLLSPSLIFDCPATMKGKGVSFARRRVVEHLSRFFRLFGRGGYALQIDFKSYFSSIEPRFFLRSSRRKSMTKTFSRSSKALSRTAAKVWGLEARQARFSLFFTRRKSTISARKFFG